MGRPTGEAAMAVNITIACTHCRKEYSVPDSLVGRRVKCKYCGEVFVAPEAAPAGVDLATLEQLEPASYVPPPITTPPRSRLTAAPGFAAGNPVEAVPLVYAAPIRARRQRFQAPGPLEDLIHDKLPLLLILVGYVLPITVALTRLIRLNLGWRPMLGALVLLGCFVGIAIPMTVTGLRIAAHVMNFELVPSPGYRIVAALSATWIAMFIYAEIVPPTLGLNQSISQIIAGVMIWLVIGMIIGVIASFGFIWLFFRLRFGEAVVTWLFAGLAYFLGTLGSIGIAYLILWILAQAFPIGDAGSISASSTASANPPDSRRDDTQADPPRPLSQQQDANPPAQAVAIAPPVPEPSVPAPSPPRPSPAPDASKPIEPAPTPDADSPPTPPRPSGPAWTAEVDAPASIAQINIHLRQVFNRTDELYLSQNGGAWLVVNPQPTAPNASFRNPIAAELWNLKTLLRAGRYPAIHPMHDVILSPGGNYLVGRALGGDPGVAVAFEVWSARNGTLVQTLATDPIAGGAVPRPVGFPKADQVLTAGDEFDVWNLKTGARIRQFADKIIFDSKTLIAPSPNCKLAAVLASDDAGVWLVSIDTGKTLGEAKIDDKPKSTGDGRTIQFSPDGREIAALIGGQWIYVWSAADGTQIGRFDVDKPVSGGPDGNTLVWMPDGQGWLVGGDRIIDRQIGDCIYLLPAIQEPGGQEFGQRRVIDNSHLVTQFRTTAGDKTALEALPIDSSFVNTRAALRADRDALKNAPQ
jgi:hypothetical protein